LLVISSICVVAFYAYST